MLGSGINLFRQIAPQYYMLTLNLHFPGAKFQNKKAFANFCVLGLNLHILSSKLLFLLCMLNRKTLNLLVAIEFVCYHKFCHLISTKHWNIFVCMRVCVVREQ